MSKWGAKLSNKVPFIIINVLCHVAANYAAFQNPSLWLGFFHMLRCCSSFAKRHACCSYVLVNAGITPPLRDRLFAQLRLRRNIYINLFSHFVSTLLRFAIVYLLFFRVFPKIYKGSQHFCCGPILLNKAICCYAWV